MQIIILNIDKQIYHFKSKKEFEMNLIFQKDNYQENVLLELLTNVKVKLIISIMQLNQYKDNLILMNYKLDNKLNK